MLAGMDDWNQKQHGSSGLIARVRASVVTVAEAEARTLEFLAPLGAARAPRRCAATASARIGAFLRASMPALERFFHYRNLDVSTLKELARRWAPQVAESFAKEGAHLALADILESIRELKHYRARCSPPAYAGG